MRWFNYIYSAEFFRAIKPARHLSIKFDPLDCVWGKRLSERRAGIALAYH
jgi:hypothetical protein